MLYIVITPICTVYYECRLTVTTENNIIIILCAVTDVLYKYYRKVNTGLKRYALCITVIYLIPMLLKTLLFKISTKTN